MAVGTSWAGAAWLGWRCTEDMVDGLASAASTGGFVDCALFISAASTGGILVSITCSYQYRDSVANTTESL